MEKRIQSILIKNERKIIRNIAIEIATTVELPYFVIINLLFVKKYLKKNYISKLKSKNNKIIYLKPKRNLEVQCSKVVCQICKE